MHGAKDAEYAMTRSKLFKIRFAATAAVLLLAFLIGLGLGLLGIVVLGAKQSLKNRQLRKDLELANRELHRLRNLSLHD